VRAWSRPFVILGRNAITLFVLSGLVGKLLIILKVPQPDGQGASLQWVIYERGFAWMAAPKNASLIYSLVFLVLIYAVCDLMHRRRIFLRA
jgi:predicted acyltransferase